MRCEKAEGEKLRLSDSKLISGPAVNRPSVSAFIEGKACCAWYYRACGTSWVFLSPFSHTHTHTLRTHTSAAAQPSLEVPPVAKPAARHFKELSLALSVSCLYPVLVLSFLGLFFLLPLSPLHFTIPVFLLPCSFFSFALSSPGKTFILCSLWSFRGMPQWKSCLVL